MRTRVPTRQRLAAASLLLASAGLVSCVSSATRQERDELLEETRRVRAQVLPDAAPAPSEQELAREARLPVLLELALQRNPDPREALERLRAALERAPAAGRLPDLEVSIDAGGMPLAAPHRWDRADMLTFGLRQTFPAPGNLEAQSRSALEEARLARASLDARVQDLVARVKRTFADYFRAHRERQILIENQQLTGQMIELARANYRAGRGSQADVLRLAVEQTRLANSIAQAEEDLATSRALLNTLMARPPDAPLGPPPQPVAEDELRVDELERRVAERLPELASARHAEARSQASLQAARAAGRWPSFMLGVDYWLMPMGMEHQHGYGLMLSFNLPWLSSRRREEVRQAERTLAADQRALENARLIARYRLREAVLRFRTARSIHQRIAGDLQVQARQSFQSLLASYASGQGDAVGLLDAFRALLTTQLEGVQALARLEVARAGQLPRLSGLLQLGRLLLARQHGRPVRDRGLPLSELRSRSVSGRQVLQSHLRWQDLRRR